jgi:hypothetical protein
MPKKVVNSRVINFICKRGSCGDCPVWGSEDGEFFSVETRMEESFFPVETRMEESSPKRGLEMGMIFYPPSPKILLK